jgi:hypothetical protein
LVELVISWVLFFCEIIVSFEERSNNIILALFFFSAEWKRLFCYLYMMTHSSWVIWCWRMLKIRKSSVSDWQWLRVIDSCRSKEPSYNFGILREWEQSPRSGSCFFLLFWKTHCVNVLGKYCHHFERHGGASI